MPAWGGHKMTHRDVAQNGDGTPIHQINLNRDGLSVSLLSLGATLQDLRLEPHAHSLVLGYRDVTQYLTNPNYFGATVGRFANRLQHGRASDFDAGFQADINTPFGHLLHGGRDGTNLRNWQISDRSNHHVYFSTTLPDGHMGFPGNLTVTTQYALLENQILQIQITAQTDAATLCSFAHHSYFNLTGLPDISGHTLCVDADHYLPIDEGGIPSGGIPSVLNTEFDFRTPRAVTLSQPIDHNLCLAHQRRPLQKVARLTAANQTISVDLATTEVGLQVYTGHGIAASGATGNNGLAYVPCAGIALEPQLWPDAPNNKGFPSALLLPDETYQQVTQFRFNTKA